MLKTIGDYAFRGCYKLSSIDFTNCEFLQEIKSHAFEGCSTLSQVILSKNLSGLSQGVFSNCLFSSFNIQDSIKYLANFCLSGCKSLQAINIGPESQLVSIGIGAFSGTLITQIHLPKMYHMLVNTHLWVLLFLMKLFVTLKTISSQ